MQNVIHGVEFGVAFLVTAIVLSWLAGLCKSIQVRANIFTTHYFNRRGKGAKAFIILSGTPPAVQAAAEVVVQVLDEAEQSVNAQKGGIGINDSTIPQNTGVPAQDKPTRRPQ